MADEDEDAIRPSGGSRGTRSTTITTASDSDSGNETTDFRFLSTLVNSATATTSALPKRGIKDFEPHATDLQASTLQASRDAMRDALTPERVHSLKNHVVGVYDVEGNGVKVRKPKGQMFQSVGKAVGGKKGEAKGGGGGGAVTVLLPEEALWLLERGALDVRWPVDEEYSAGSTSKDEGDDEQDDGGLPMSLQGAYAAFIGEEARRGGWLTLEKYQVYAHLKRAGFIVLRTENWNSSAPRRRTEVHDYVPGPDRSPADDQNLLVRLWKLFTGNGEESEQARRERQRAGPLVKPGLYRSYDEIFRMTHLVRTAKPHAVSPKDQETSTEEANIPKTERGLFTTHFNVYKPTPSFRKSAPGPPDFRICIVSARETSFPTLDELDSLLSEQSLAPPNTEAGSGTVGSMYSRLRHGQRHVLLAVVDEGVVSILRIGESGFGEERLYERAARAGAGGKRGRGGAGGNRGRGSARGATRGKG